MVVVSKIKKSIPKRKPILPKPKITFGRLGQLVFTFKEATKLALQVNPRLLILLFVLNAIWGFTAAPGFYLEKLIIDSLVANIGTTDVRAAVMAVGILVALRLLLELTRNILSRVNQFLRRTLSRLFEAELSVIIGKKLAELDLETIEDPDFKDKFDKIVNESGRRAWGLMIPLSDIPNYLIGFISSVGLLIILHPLVTIGVIIMSIPQVFVDSRYIKKGYKLRTELSPLHRVWGWLNYYLVRNRNYMEMKILSLTSFLSDKLKGVQKAVLSKQIELSKKRQVSSFAGVLPLTLFEFGVSIWLIFLVVVERITIGSFEMYLRALRSSGQNLTSLVSSILEIYENYIYVNDLVWFLGLDPKIEGNVGGKKLINKSSEIEFKNVWFKYRDSQPWVLKDVNLKINKKENVALVGLNGSGKSTLIKLIARFYDPQKGEVLVDKVKLASYDLETWRNNLSVLFQEFESYPFSAKESIGYGDVSRINNIEEIKEAAKKTGMDEFIEGLPKKYNNPLDPVFEKGVRPSIGQAQRIGISRMLFRKDANIVIMDEPTSSVDPEAEEKIFQELIKETKDKILIFVTQRFSTVRLADRIFVVDKGKIIEHGTHKKLIKFDGKYAKLFNLQAKAYQ